MAANAIYFPSINVPPDPWLLRMLLYWDQLSSIVPIEYHHGPGRLDSKMRDMVAAGLVKPIAPGMYLRELDGFAAPFLHFAERWKRPHWSQRKWPQTQIHMEKLDQLVEPLVDMGVARRADGPWFEMPAPLADRFMAYLASALGRVPAIDAAPVTNSTMLGQSLLETSLAAKRDALLEVLFPVPHGSEKLTLDDIVEFKAKHQALAARFRERLQDECILLADGTSNEERQLRLDALARKLQGEVEEITEAMRGRWQRVVLGKVAPVLAPLISLLDANPATQVATFLGAGLSVGLAGYQAKQIQAAEDAAMRRPLAYIALARQRLPALRPSGIEGRWRR